MQKDKEQLTPSFAVVGAMKAGTSSVYYTLRRSEEISLTRHKEPNYFLQDSDVDRFDQYKALFIGSGLRGDVSPNYTRLHRYPEVPRRMFNHNPGMKLIYILRDPIERIISHLWHDMLNDRLGRKEADTKAFEENYIKTSSYYFQIRGFLEFFPRDQLLLIPFHNLINEPEKVFRDIFQFLDLDINRAPTGIIAANRSKQRYKKVYRDAVRPVLKKIGLWTFYKYFCYFLNIKVQKPSLNEETKRALSERLMKDVQMLDHQFDIDLSAWSVHKYLNPR